MKKFLDNLILLGVQQRKWTALILVSLVTLISLSLIMPQSFINLAIVRKQLKTQKHYLEAGSVKLKALEDVEERSVEIFARMNEGKARFFSEKEASLFLKNLDKLVAKTKGHIILIKPLSEETVATSAASEEEPFVYRKSFIQVHCRLGFKALLKLLNIFETNQKLIGVEDMRISSGQRESKELVVQFKLVLHKLVKET